MNEKVLIIAEAGVNHNGNIELAKRLIDEAKETGADIVKFQTFIAEKVISSNAAKAAYQVNNTSTSESQLDLVKKLELSFDDFRYLKKYASEKGIEFLSTPFDTESIFFLKQLGIRIFKIPSGEITNLPYLTLIGSFGMEVIISTGMCTLDEIGRALDILIKAGTPLDSITVLHCSTEYPTPMEDVNLRAMLQIKERFGVQVGYSDHSKGIEVAIASVALGARVIEKHFTLDKNMEGPDHKASLDPAELKQMVDAIRNIEIAMGDGIKRPMSSEIKNIAIARKSIHLSRDITEGTLLSSDMLEMKRPGDGISPMEIDTVIGRRVNKDLTADHKLSFNDLV